jgi:hypothetical protein
MYKILSGFLLVTFIACNSKSPKVAGESSSENAAKQTVASSWTRDAEMHWMDECVANAKDKLGEEKAFNQCKCMLRQWQAQNPANDSLRDVSIKNDTVLVNAMFKNCEGVK